MYSRDYDDIKSTMKGLEYKFSYYASMDMMDGLKRSGEGGNGCGSGCGRMYVGG